MSDGVNELLSSETRGEQVRRLVLELQCPRHVQRLAAGRSDPDRARDDVGARRRRSADRELHAPGAAGADDEVARSRP